MTEHEKLKEICDKIGYESNFQFKEGEYHYKYGCCTRVCVREIIFTNEFMEKYVSYCENNGIIATSRYKEFLIDLFRNLDNPVEYLYTLIK